MAGRTIRTREKTMWKDEEFISKKVDAFHRDMSIFAWRGTDEIRTGEVMYNQALSYLQHEYNRMPPKRKEALLKVYSPIKND